MLKTVLVATLMIAFAACTTAASVTLLWDYTEDVALLPDGGFKIYQKKQTDTVYPTTAAATIAPNTHTVTLTVSPGKYCWVATAFVPTLESAPSNEVCGQATPNKPLNLRVP